MPLSYEDLIEPTIVRQESRSVAYCRCTRSKNLPFCDGSHDGTNMQPAVLEFAQPGNHRHLPLLEIEGPSLLRRHPRPLGETQRAPAQSARLMIARDHEPLERFEPHLNSLNDWNVLNPN